MKSRKLVAALACRNQGSRLYGKPLQNLDIENRFSILDHILACLGSFSFIDEIVLGISEGVANETFIEYASVNGIRYIVGDEIDVLSRLIQCGELANATDIFRVTTESPFLYFDPLSSLWLEHCEEGYDATFMFEIIDGCGFEIYTLDALIKSHRLGNSRHRSELCSLYVRENPSQFKVNLVRPPQKLIRQDLRLTVDHPEDLVVCRFVYQKLQQLSPLIPVDKIVDLLDQFPELVKLTLPYTEAGYKLMNFWDDHA
jgi:spore coat polysaccharide biosynthesis protein SpsF